MKNYIQPNHLTHTDKYGIIASVFQRRREPNLMFFKTGGVSMNYLIWLSVVALVAYGVRRWCLQLGDKRLTPIQRAYRAWGKAEAGSEDSEFAAAELNKLIIAVLDEQATSEGLNYLYHGHIYWDSSTEKNGEAVSSFFNAKYAKLRAEEKAEFARIEAEQNRISQEREAKFLKQGQAAETLEQARQVSCEVACHFSRSSPAWILAHEKWDRLSLEEVLHAKTLAELHLAKCRARNSSLALRFMPFMHEKISMVEVETSDSVDSLIKAGETAPEGVVRQQTALYICFLKLYHRVSTNNRN